MICLCYVVLLAGKNCGVMTKSARVKFSDATRRGLRRIMTTVQPMAIKCAVYAVTKSVSIKGVSTK